MDRSGGSGRSWLLISVAGAIVVLLLVASVSLVLVRMARARAATYLAVVIPLRVGSTYELAYDQMRERGLHPSLSGDCRRECTLSVEFNNKLQHLLHLAPISGLVGQLEFEEGKLHRKRTVLVAERRYATVNEDKSVVSRVQNRQEWIWVEVSPSDFTEYRNEAYAFNTACIGSIKACGLEQLLPTLNRLER